MSGDDRDRQQEHRDVANSIGLALVLFALALGVGMCTDILWWWFG